MPSRAEYTKGLYVEIEGGTSPRLTKAVKDATFALNSLERSYKNINKSIEFDPHNPELYKQRLEILNLTIKETEDTLKELTTYKDALDVAGVSHANEEYQRTVKVIAETTKKLEEYKNLLPIIEKGLGKIHEEVVKSSKDMDRLASINKAISLDPKNPILYAEKQAVVNAELNNTRVRLYQLQDYQELIGKTVDKSNEKYVKTSELIAEAKKRIETLSKETSYLPANVQAFNGKLEATGQKLIDISNKSRNLSRAFASVASASIKEAISYETEIANIEKITGELADGIVDSLKEIAVETGNTFSNVSEYASIGATLGIAQDDLVGFTKTMLDLQTATNGSIIGEEGAKSVARFLNVMNLGAENVDRFGAAITYVGDHFAATGDEILEVATNIAGLGTITGVTQNDVIGLAAEMKNLGLRSASSSSAIVRTFMKMNTAVETGEGGLKTFAEISGMTSEQFQKAWGEDAMGAFLKFTDGLKSQEFRRISEDVRNGTKDVEKYAEAMEMSAEQFRKAWGEDAQGTFEKYIESLANFSDESESASVYLKELGLDGVRTAETLLKLAGNADVVRDAINMSSDAWESNSALIDKANTVYQTTEMQLKGAFEALKQSGALLAKSFLPSLTKLANGIKDVSEWISKLNPKTRELLFSFILLGAGFSTVTNVLGNGMRDIRKFIEKLGKNKQALDLLKKSSDGLSTTFSTLTSTVLSPVGLYAGLTLLAGGLVLATGKAMAADDAFSKVYTSATKYRDSLKETSDNADISFQKQEAMINYTERYIDKIDELTKKLKDKSLTDEEEATIQSQLNGYIDKVNEALGYEAIHLNDANILVDEQGQKVKDLGQKWMDMTTEAKKNAWLNTHQKEYEEAFQVYQDVMKQRSDLNHQYSEDMKGYASQDVAYAKWLVDTFKEAMANGDTVKAQTITELLEDNDELAKLFSIISEYNAGMEMTSATMDQATEKMNNYDAVLNSTGETFNDVLADITNGYFKLGENVEELREQEKELTEAIELAKVAGADEMYVKELEEELALVQEEINKEIELGDTYKEQAEKRIGAIDGIANAVTTNSEMIKDKVTKSFSEIQEDGDTKLVSPFDNMKKVGENIMNGLVGFWNGLHFADKTVTIRENYIAASKGASGGIPRGGGSSGFGYYDGVLNSIYKTLNTSQAIHSGGFTSNRVSLNTSFVINNGNNIGRETVTGWTRDMIDVINNELGRLM